jgi:threonine/homoserine/homoserine lactone efflux protein
MELFRALVFNVVIIGGAFYLLHLAAKSSKQKSKHKHV